MKFDEITVDGEKKYLESELEPGIDDDRIIYDLEDTIEIPVDSIIQNEDSNE